MKDNELKALIHLLDDPDEEIFGEVSRSIVERGLEIIPELERAWEMSLNEVLQTKIETLIQQIQLSAVQRNLTSWVHNGSTDLLEGAFYIAKYQFPELAYSKIVSAIEDYKHDVWLEVNNNLTALEKVRVINHILFFIHKFSGNSANYYSPQNSFINQVIETRKGNPISLSIVYATVAQKLGIPVYGVNLPRNFILAYKDEPVFSSQAGGNDADHVLFYINPYNQGAVLGKREIDYFVKQQKMENDPTYYSTCTNNDIVQRLVLNLIYSYEKLGYTEKMKDLKSLLKILNPYS